MTLSDISTVLAGAFEAVFEVDFEAVLEAVFEADLEVEFGVVFEVVFIDIDLLCSPIYRDVDYKKLLADRIIFKKDQKHILTYQESNRSVLHKAKLMH